MKNIRVFYLKIFSFMVKFPIYLNKRVIVMSVLVLFLHAGNCNCVKSGHCMFPLFDGAS